MQNTTRRLIVWAAVITLILLVPLVAMQFTAEVDWDLIDFVVGGALLFGAGLTYELITRTGDRDRLAVGTAIAAAVLLIWAYGAVGGD